MKKFKKVLLTSLLPLTLFTQSIHAEDYGIRAFYGDKLLDRVVAIDVESMTLAGTIDTIGIDPYPVDQAGKLNKVYAITRGSNSIDVINASTLEPIGLIELEHFPRSAEAYNATLELQLVSGADKPMASLIDVHTDSVVATVGDSDSGNIVDYGGSNATGHPFWFDEKRFALIDRANRTINMYKIVERKGRRGGYNVMLMNTVSTPTAVHHFVKRDRTQLEGRELHTYYALAEGSPNDDVAPTVLKYILKQNQLHLVAEVALAETGDDVIADMGSHHADIHPDGKHIYVGSTEGNIYIVNIKRMKMVRVIEAGLGAGHTKFIPEKNLAIITNHKDTFLTIINSKNHEKIKDVTVSEKSIHGEILQSHSTFVHPNKDFFYAFATDNGIFYELDLNTLTVSRTLETGGTPLQGVFMSQNEDYESSM